MNTFEAYKMYYVSILWGTSENIRRSSISHKCVQKSLQSQCEIYSILNLNLGSVPWDFPPSTILFLFLRFLILH